MLYKALIYFMKHIVSILMLLLAVTLSSSAQDVHGEFSAQRQYDVQFEQTDMKYAFEDYKGGHRSWQRKFYKELRTLLGLERLEEIYKDFVPYAEQLDCEDLGDITRERWQVWTEPTMAIPFVLLRPKGEITDRPLIITPHGHDRNPEIYSGIYADEKEKEYIMKADKDLALQAARRGFIAINPTTRGFGMTMHPDDIKADAKYSCRYYHLRGLIAGRTLIGDRVWDVMKVIDWALANLPVDRDRIVVSGNSGGGTVSLYAGAMDRRISLCVPSSAFSSFAASIGTVSHCHCNYLPGIMHLCEMGDIAGLVVPRKLLIMNGVKDRIFPIDAARSEYETVKSVYEAFGAGDNCEMFEGAEGHRYYMAALWDFLGRKYDTDGLNL